MYWLNPLRTCIAIAFATKINIVRFLIPYYVPSRLFIDRTQPCIALFCFFAAFHAEYPELRPKGFVRRDLFRRGDGQSAENRRYQNETHHGEFPRVVLMSENWMGTRIL